ncbi:MAG TPA: type II secretion system protein GspI [Gammaproteobacteria bacterium]|nr:type II secretion system protein GspI [Gammaproteobacteria bacterium]
MKHAAQGFTLLEVLIAMVVLALSLGAVIQSTGDYTVNQAYLRDRTFAEWVARNQLATALMAETWPSTGQTRGEVEFPKSVSGSGGREWRWEMQVSQTPEQDLRRLDIDVFPLDADDDAQPLATLSGFMGKP